MRMTFGPSRLLLVCLLLAGAVAAQDLTDASYASWRDRVLPASDELQWRRIGWRDALGTAVLEAVERDRPVLLWVMNGHPLGCT